MFVDKKYYLLMHTWKNAKLRLTSCQLTFSENEIVFCVYFETKLELIQVILGLIIKKNSTCIFLFE
jgi:hypothetical protein